jgi:ketosteroid isomerase-like protein
MLPTRTAVIALLLVPVAAVVTCSPNRAGSPGIADTRDALEVVRDAENVATEAWNRGDLEAHVAIYADTGTGGPPIAPGGRARARLALSSYFTSERPALRLDSLRVSPLGPSYVLSSGKWTLAGKGAAHSGWFTHVWARLPVGWRIVYEHST